MLACARYRAAVFGQEEFCYGVLEHSGHRGRRWREAKEVFATARRHQDLLASPLRGNAKVALLFDVEAAFAWASQPMSTAFDYETEAWRLFHPFWRQGAAVDVLSLPHLLAGLLTRGLGDGGEAAVPDGAAAAESHPATVAAALLARYRVLLLPVPLVLGGPRQPGANATAAVSATATDGAAAQAAAAAAQAAAEGSAFTVRVLEAFVSAGGSLWTSFRGDLKDASAQVRPHASRLAKLAGVEVNEIESLNDPVAVTLAAPGGSGSVGGGAVVGAAGATATASVFREGLRVIPAPPRPPGAASYSLGDGEAEVVWAYSDAFFGPQGLSLAAVTRRRVLHRPPNATAAVVAPSTSPPWSSSSSSSSSSPLSSSSSLPPLPPLRVRDGEVVYVGCGVDPEAGLLNLAADTLVAQGLLLDGLDGGLGGHGSGLEAGSPHAAGAGSSVWVEQVLRKDARGETWRVAINHGEEAAFASDGTPLEPFAVDVKRLPYSTSPAARL